MKEDFRGKHGQQPEVSEPFDIAGSDFAAPLFDCVMHFPLQWVRTRKSQTNRAIDSRSPTSGVLIYR